MFRTLLLMMLMMPLVSMAGFESLTIAHTKIVPRTIVNTGYWAFFEIVGNFDRAEDGRTVSQAIFQYKIGEGDWRMVDHGDPRLRPSSHTFNYRKFDLLNFNTHSFSIRACREGRCSEPKVVHLTPQFVRILTPASGTVSPFNRNLRFSMIHHQVGGIKFQIGKLRPYPTTDFISYQGKEEVYPVGKCPQLPPLDTLACEISIPDSVFAEPGSYSLTATSVWGNSINHLDFNVVSTFKVVKVVPEFVQTHLHDVLTLHFGGGGLSPRQIDVSISAPCSFRRLPLTPAGNDKLVLRLPPQCLPQTGVGEIELDVTTPEGPQKIKVPYEL